MIIRAFHFFYQVKTIDKGVGVPIEAELIPLSQLSRSPKLQFLVDISIQTKIGELESMYFDVRTTLAATKALLKRHPTLSKMEERDIGQFYGRIFNITRCFNDAIASINLNVYTKKGNQFEKAFDAYRDGKLLLPDKYMREYSALEARIEPVRYVEGFHNLRTQITRYNLTLK